MNHDSVIWICYTTQYREGGESFRAAAETKADELKRKFPSVRVECAATETKREFVGTAARFASEGLRIQELHFLGHSGMYGPMFRTTALPEQFSPHEWRTLNLPFAPSGEAYFHCCRSARWFAPFFARTFGVPTYGFHLYTTLSRSQDRYTWAGVGAPRRPLYVVAVPGKKSHGPLGSISKHLRLAQVERMKRFEPKPIGVEASYDRVAALYDEMFQDIGVRRTEVEWIERKLPPSSKRVLEIGCGTGGLLTRLAPRLSLGIGVDASEEMLVHARRRAANFSHLSFQQVTSPTLPADDQSVDVVISMLSWRYLDWDPLMAEIRRVLAPGGRLLMVDMVALPSPLKEWPRMFRDQLSDRLSVLPNANYRRARQRLTQDPHWKVMLEYNPIRAEHEYRWYFESRFPGQKLETLRVGFTSRVVAFDSGPLSPGYTPPQSYP